MRDTDRGLSVSFRVSLPDNLSLSTRVSRELLDDVQSIGKVIQHTHFQNRHSSIGYARRVQKSPGCYDLI